MTQYTETIHSDRSLFSHESSDDEEDERAAPGYVIKSAFVARMHVTYQRSLSHLRFGNGGNQSTSHIANHFFDTQDRRKKNKRKRAYELYGESE